MKYGGGWPGRRRPAMARAISSRIAWISGLSSPRMDGVSRTSAIAAAVARAVTERMAVMGGTSLGLRPARRRGQHGEPLLRLELLLHLDLADQQRRRRGGH